jgi:hypothetical protein
MFTFSVHGKSWEPGIGDPTFMGWLTVAAYFGASLLCWLAARKLGQAGSGWGGARLFWCIFAVFLLVLGINKQLDIQTLFTLVGKRISLAGGWYEQRRPVQAAFIGFIFVMSGLGLIGLRLVAGRLTRPILIALCGGVFLGAFILMRAASFHYVDQMLGWRFGGMKMNWILELSGIFCIGLAAIMALRFRAPPASQGGPNFTWVSAGDRLKHPPA